MMSGVVIRIFPNRGFGFIRGADHVSRFFHAMDVTPQSDFDMMHEGTAVRFDSADGRKPGTLRAIKVVTCS